MRISDWSSDVCSSDLISSMPSQLRDLICSGKADGLRLSTGVAGSCESKEMTIASPPLVKQRRSRDPELTQNLILKAATDTFAMHGFEGATLQIGRAPCRERVWKEV